LHPTQTRGIIMNLNPFVYSYKHYPNSKLATNVNNFCSAIQRLFIVFATIIILVVIFDDVSNWGEALCGAGVMLLLWIIIRYNKNKWSDKIATKQDAIDNPNNTEEK